MLDAGIDFGLDVELHRASGGVVALDVVKGSASLTYTSDAEVKMAFSFRAVYDGAFNYPYDQVAPYLWLGGTRYALGRYIIVEAQRQHTGTHSEYALTCFDLCQRARRMKAEERPYYIAGTPYTEVIGGLLLNCGIGLYDIDATTAVLATDREDWEPGTSYLTIINDLLAEISYNSLCMRTDGTVAASAKNLATAENITKTYHNRDVKSILVPGGSVDIDAFDHPNVFYYSCENPEFTESLNAYAENSSTYNRHSTVFSPRNAVFVRVDNVPDAAALQALADAAKFESMISADMVSFETGLSVHGPNEVVAVTKDMFEGIVQEIGWSMDLRAGGLMRHTGRWAVYG